MGDVVSPLPPSPASRCQALPRLPIFRARGRQGDAGSRSCREAGEAPPGEMLSPRPAPARCGGRAPAGAVQRGPPALPLLPTHSPALPGPCSTRSPAREMAGCASPAGGPLERFPEEVAAEPEVPRGTRKERAPGQRTSAPCRRSVAHPGPPLTSGQCSWWGSRGTAGRGNEAGGARGPPNPSQGSHIRALHPDPAAAARPRQGVTRGASGCAASLPAPGAGAGPAWDTQCPSAPGFAPAPRPQRVMEPGLPRAPRSPRPPSLQQNRVSGVTLRAQDMPPSEGAGSRGPALAASNNMDTDPCHEHEDTGFGGSRFLPPGPVQPLGKVGSRLGRQVVGGGQKCALGRRWSGGELGLGGRGEGHLQQVPGGRGQRTGEPLPTPAHLCSTSSPEQRPARLLSLPGLPTKQLIGASDLGGGRSGSGGMIAEEAEQSSLKPTL
ncbi:unnamed protein product [Lepidochelys olivacea]